MDCLNNKYIHLAPANENKKRQGLRVKAHMSQRPKRQELILVSIAWSIEACLGVLLLPAGWDACPSQDYPPAVWCRYPFIRLGEGRQSGVNFLVQNETTYFGHWFIITVLFKPVIHFLGQLFLEAFCVSQNSFCIAVKESKIVNS